MRKFCYLQNPCSKGIVNRNPRKKYFLGVQTMAAPIDLSTATSLEGQVYAAVLALQSQELAIDIENRPDNAQVTFDVENSTVTLGVTLGSTFAVAGGTATFTVQEYLT